MTSLLAALQFLTRAPLPVRFALGPADMGRSMRWFPFVGALIGALVALIDAALAPVTTLEVRSVLAVLLLAAITGGLHLDGLMDSCDGLLAFTTPERRLKIMADSRVGSFAVVGLVTAVLLKYAAILALPAPLRAPGLVAMGALSRWTMVYATVRYPSARSDGLGNTYKQGVGRRELVIATTLAVLLVLPLYTVGLAAAAIAWVVAALLARYAIAKIGGLTGDVYGAISEATEIAVAVALPPLARALGS